MKPNPDHPTKSLHAITTALQSQYERWQPKAKYKAAPDPTVSTLKRICEGLRRSAKDERLLFHYNGHGVPRPTANGELWVFNDNYSKYIPLNLFDLNEVLGNPTLYVFDCHSAGTVLFHFLKMNEQLERDWQERCRVHATNKAIPPHQHSVLLAACADSQLLPLVSHMPADLFTACLTTPIKTALRWFARRSLVPDITDEMIDRIPGDPKSRSSPLGELESILAAIVDTIAWDVLPRDLFIMLFRKDLLLSSLMGNFILAQRIMRSFGCTPVSYPEIPRTHYHSLWHAFDVALESLFSQLPLLIDAEDALAPSIKLQTPGPENPRFPSSNSTVASSSRSHPSSGGQPPRHTAQAEVGESAPSGTDRKMPFLPKTYRPFTFFTDQMKAFSVWLDMGPDSRDPPEQLPIIFHVLFCPKRRVKALPLISRYLQTGPAAVDIALAVGIFPYMLGLLTKPSPEIREDLVFIWSKILAFDHSGRTDLAEQKVDQFFVDFLRPTRAPEEEPKPVHLACAMFVLSVIARQYADRCRAIGTVEACFPLLTHEGPFVRRWACLCLTEVFAHASPPAQLQALESILVDTLRDLTLFDKSADVRAAAVSTLSVIMNGVLRRAPSLSSPVLHPALRTNFRPLYPIPDVADKTSRPKHVPGQTKPIHCPPMQVKPPTDINIVNSLSQDGLVYSDALDALAPALPYSKEESDALLKIGFTIAGLARNESSVLVRREIATGIARAACLQMKRFIRASLILSFYGTESEHLGTQIGHDTQCEDIYRALWTSLSELAFDPHPVDAVIARGSYDRILDVVTKRMAQVESIVTSPSISPTNKLALSPEEGESVGCSILPSSKSADSSGASLPNMLSANRDGAAPDEWRAIDQATSPKGHARYRSIEDYETLLRGSRVSRSLASPSLPPGDKCGVEGRSDGFPHRGGQCDASSSPRVLAGPIHVRSASGSFDLNMSSHISKKGGNGLISRNEYGTSPRLGLATFKSEELTEPTETNGESDPSDERPQSLPHMMLVKGMSDLMKTFSHFGRATGAPSSSTRPRNGNAVPQETKDQTARGSKDAMDVKAISPPRPPRRSLSYQVLTAEPSLSPNGETPLPMFKAPNAASSMRPPTGRFAPAVTNDSARTEEDMWLGSNHMQLASTGNAAVSLYDWSSTNISHAEIDASSLDYTLEEEGMPRYAMLWNKINTTNRSKPIADTLRRFALLGRRDEVVGLEAAEGGDQFGTLEQDQFSSAQELSNYDMGAGGGGITALTFLPRDTGIGDDQLIATGDTTGSVGVYDARSGKCHGAFGIPLSPGECETGVSCIICLNPLSSECGPSVSNSQSALILGGAYDGRVAVFKSDFAGSKYQIMSTFQASGRVGFRKSGCDLELRGEALSAVVRERGNGLVVGFNGEAAYLAAGGCDESIVRVWDLASEKCTWEGHSVSKGAFPSSLTMWKSESNEVFVVGASDGAVNVIDMREGSGGGMGGARHVHKLGMHEDPIISIGTCPCDANMGRLQTVVSADAGGEIVFWDARWNGARVSDGLHNGNMHRITSDHRNLTSMCVHRTGQYIASGSSQGVKVYDSDRRVVKTISHYEQADVRRDPQREARVGQQMASVTRLAFQHESSLLAIGCEDSTVVMYGRHRELFPGIQS